MKNNTRKYILIPDFKPLWAMRECFGPTHGPLSEPCPTPLDIIGKLLQQDGRDSLTIMEVLDPSKGQSTPVKLTLDNYTLSYEDILAGKTLSKVTTEDIVKKGDVIEPEINESDKRVVGNIRSMLNGEEPPEVVPSPVVDVKTDEDPVADEQVETEDNQEKTDSPAEDDKKPAEGSSDTAEPHHAEIWQLSTETDVATDSSVTVATSVTTNNPYAGMSKAERRAARRAAAAAAAKENAEN